MTMNNLTHNILEKIRHPLSSSHLKHLLETPFPKYMRLIASFFPLTIHVTPAQGMLWVSSQGLLYLCPIPNTVNKLKYNFVETPHKFIVTKLTDRKLWNNKFMWCFKKLYFSLILTMQMYKGLKINYIHNKILLRPFLKIQIYRTVWAYFFNNLGN